MNHVKARNVHQMFPELMYRLRNRGVDENSRNGPVRRLPGPTVLEYEKPCERVMFWPRRDANPFFHLLESMWMLDGRNDVEFLASIVGTMANYSDDGETFNGAYGHRWRHHFGIDQLETIIQALQANPNCRRQVLAMWDGHHDLGLQSKDLPCNTHIYFAVNHHGTLDMTVCNRSNDAVWGATGANAVHFSFLQEYVACSLGRGVGRYFQISNNMHLYTDVHGQLMEDMAVKAETVLTQTTGGKFMSPSEAYQCPYARGTVATTPLFSLGKKDEFDTCNKMLLQNGPVTGMSSSFIRRVVIPMYTSIGAYKSTKKPDAFEQALAALQPSHLMNSDWITAAAMWIQTRKKQFDSQRAIAQPTHEKS